MPLQFLDVVKAKLIDVNPRSEKHGLKDLEPAIDLRFQLDCGNHVLSMYDPELLDFLFVDDPQLAFDVIEKISDRTKLRFPDLVQPLHWTGESKGNTLTLDYGIGGESNLTLTDCKVHKHAFATKEGGSCTVAFTASCAHDLSEAAVGRLGTRVQHDVFIQLQQSDNQESTGVDNEG
jgi:hypothetical protein